MDGLRIPQHPAWFMQSGCVCTPDNGFLYITGKKFGIGYISEIKNAAPEVKIIYSNVGLNCIDCEPDWNETKYFATFDENNAVHVWDFESEKIVKGHKAHINCVSNRFNNKTKLSSTTATGVISFTHNRQLISICGKILVNYCIISNKFKIFNDISFVKRNTITILCASPYDKNLMAAGTKNGLIIVFNSKIMEQIYTLRAHDYEIISLDWMLYPVENKYSTNNNTNIDINRLDLPEPKPIMDANDMFDVYAFEHLDNEFGTSSSNNIDPSSRNNNEEHSNQTEILDNDKFNFVEACQNLKDDILGTNKLNISTVCNSNTLVNVSLMEECKNSQEFSANDSSDDFENINDESMSQMGNENSNGKTEINKRTYLISSAREPYVWIWDIDAGGIGLHKIDLKVHSKSSLPSIFIVTRWINQNTIITTNPCGNINMYKINIDNNDGVKCVLQNVEFCDKAITGISKNTNNGIATIWTVSIQYQIVCTKLSDPIEVIAKYSTLSLRMYAISECPHDLNKLAIAGNFKRINILNTSNWKYNNSDFTSYMSKIQSKILSLAWHPIYENILAFSTDEGRVGIIDIDKITTFPIIMKPFTGKSVYSITWSFIITDVNESNNCVLFACDSKKLVYFPQNGVNKYVPVTFDKETDVTSVHSGEVYIAIGKQNGTIALYTKQLKKIWSEKPFNKYISEFSWNLINKNKLAVCSMDNYIILIDCENEADIKITGKLIGHISGLTCVKWSNESEYKLVSTSLDNTVRVWNTEKLECISIYRVADVLFSAIFYPTNDNFILCSGKSETLKIFDSTKYFHEEKCSINKPKTVVDIEWAQLEATNVNKLTKREQKTTLKNDIDNLTNTLNNVLIIDGKPEKKCIRYIYTTILNLSHRELNKDSIDLLAKILKCNDDKTYASNDDAENNADNEEEGTTIKEYLNLKLFSSRDDVKELLTIELKNHKMAYSESLAHVIVPQVTNDLKNEILNCINKKDLTEQHVALAPMISYEFWKNCCKCLAHQYIEKNWVLPALPYLLACYEINVAIETLCNSGYFREALVVAKLHKEEDDLMFEHIYTNWINDLDNKGNLEAAAVIAVATHKFKLASEILTRRKNKSIELEKVLDALNTKL